MFYDQIVFHLSRRLVAVSLLFLCVCGQKFARSSFSSFFGIFSSDSVFLPPPASIMLTSARAEDHAIFNLVMH